MKKETVFVEMSDGKKVALHTWIPDGDVKAVVQLSHGMAEFAMRYDRFAEICASNGIAFYGHDHRGHGETAANLNDLGYLADKDGFQRVVLDVHEMVMKAHADFPEKPVFLFGHSFGSFVAQSFIEQFGKDISGCVLCGSAGPRLPLTRAGHFLAGTIKLFTGARKRSKIIDNIAFGAYNSHIPDAKSDFDWLSHDLEELQKYQDNPYCGFKCTNEFFYDFFGGLCTIHKKANMKKIRQDLPVFIIAGEEDPVGDWGKTVPQLHAIYKENGIKDLTLKMYPGCRHELLNETNHAEVEQDILGWFTSHIA